jgi:hypothetical protein
MSLPPSSKEELISMDQLFDLQRKVSVPSIFDEGYNQVRYQAAWCAALIGKKYGELREHFFAKNETFQNIYRECLQEGTELRRLHGQYTHGESFTSKNLVDQLDLQKHIFFPVTYASGDRSKIDLLPADVRSEYYDRMNLAVKEFSALKSYKFCLVSMNAHVFTLIPMFGTHFIIFDPHASHAGMLSSEDVTNYLKNETTEEGKGEEYLQVNILCCA